MLLFCKSGDVGAESSEVLDLISNVRFIPDDNDRLIQDKGRFRVLIKTFKLDTGCQEHSAPTSPLS